MLPINRYIDHTLLKPEATVSQIRQLCAEAREYGFYAVCVNPCYVALASRLLSDCNVKTAAVIGFPLGANMPEVKAYEAEAAIRAGADELDSVINIGAAKSGQWEIVCEDIEAVVKAAGDKLVKVIIETGLLTVDEKRFACEALMKAGAHYVKTSTGFGPGGATVEDILLLKSIIDPDYGIKASGGIRNRAVLLKMLDAGATRIGTSSGVSIMNEI